MNCATCRVVIGGLGASTPEKAVLDKAKELGLEFKEPICNDCFKPFREKLEADETPTEQAGYCIDCGSELPDGANFCPQCGFKNEDMQIPQSRERIVYVGHQMDEPNSGLAFLSFLLPIVGLILWLTWKDSHPLKAGSCGKGAAWGFITGCVLVFFIATSMAKQQESALQEYNRAIQNIERDSERHWQNYQLQKRLQELDSERRYLERNSF